MLASALATALPESAATTNVSTAKLWPIYVSAGAIGSQRRQSVRIASVADCPADVMYVSDPANNVIHIFPVAPRPQPECGRITAGLNDPQGLALDAHGDLFVANTSAFNILKFKPGHANPSLTISDAGEYPAGVSVNASGLIAVTNYQSTTMNQNGMYGPGTVSMFEPNGTPIGTFSDPTAVHEYFPKVDASGNVYTTFSNNSNGSGSVNEFIAATGYQTVVEDTNITEGFPGGIDLFDGLLYVGDQNSNVINAYVDGAYIDGQTSLSRAVDAVTFEVRQPIGCAVLCGPGYYPLFTADEGTATAQEYISDLGTFVNAHRLPSDSKPFGIAITRPM